MISEQPIEQALWLAPAAAFFLTGAILPPYIRYLRQRKIQQYLREDGPKSHQEKKGTPTGGGVVFVVAILSAVAFVFGNSFISASRSDLLAVVSIALGCFALGLMDDLQKIRSKSNTGISARQRLATEMFLGAILGCVIIPSNSWNGALHEPGLNAVVDQLLWNYPVLLIMFSAFLVGATSNALNLHDGMDGLASGTAIMVFGTIGFLCTMVHRPDLALIAYTTCGALTAFLCFNRHKAQIMMGDTGSLFLGGLMAALVMASGTFLYFVPLSIIYIAEALSVILQVIYFKLTKEYKPEKPMSAPALIVLKLTRRLPGEGKRLFRMAPLHHHFEAVYAERGVTEWQVVTCFWAVQALVCLAVLALFMHFH